MKPREVRHSAMHVLAFVEVKPCYEPAKAVRLFRTKNLVVTKHAMLLFQFYWFL